MVIKTKEKGGFLHLLFFHSRKKVPYIVGAVIFLAIISFVFFKSDFYRRLKTTLPETRQEDEEKIVLPKKMEEEKKSGIQQEAQKEAEAAAKEAEKQEELQRQREAKLPIVTFTKLLSITGNVKSIKDNAILVDAHLPNEPQPQSRKVIVNADTKIIKFEVLRVGGEIKSKESAISLKDIKIGNLIIITAKENIIDKTEFNAVIIQLFKTSL